MGLGIQRTKIEDGSGGKRGHSNPLPDGFAVANMTRWDYTEEIKRRSRKARRVEGKAFERQARQNRTDLD
ncbi:MAG: hypothetical protein ACREIF_08035 [Chthoniobacterales bacterium]